MRIGAARTLARLGGDEFAVLVPNVRNRGEVREIAMRLERSFDDPFAIDGHLLHGSASMGIAIYPEDGTTAGPRPIANQEFFDRLGRRVIAASSRHRSLDLRRSAPWQDG